jgi:hypothetical protein
MVSRKGRTRGSQCGMVLPEGITSSKPSSLWKIIKVIYDDGPGNYKDLQERMKARWKYYPAPNSLYTTLKARSDVFIMTKDNGNFPDEYDLREEIRNAMD